MKVVIVGGVAGGATAAARIRRLDEQADIVVFERSGYISYANCGLPYYVGDVITDSKNLTLQTPESFYKRFRVDMKVRHEVIDIDTEKKLVIVKNLDTEEVFKESYDKLILSPGAKANTLGMNINEMNKVFTLRTVEDTFRIKEYIEKEKPKSVVLVGGGFIGLELAENMHQLEMDVTIVESKNQLMTVFDADMAAYIHSKFRKEHVNLLFNTSVKGIEEHDNGVNIVFEEKEPICADMVVFATGVKPESTLAKKAGLDLGINESILVNEKMETSKTDVYAVGDVVQIKNSVTSGDTLISLAGPANKQGRIVADNICGGNSIYKGSEGSCIIKFFDMTAASTGINEKIAKEAGIDYEKIVLSPMNHATYYPGGKVMTMKVLFEKKTYRLLGAQIIGYEGVDKRIDVLATAIHVGMKASDLKELELCYAPPYSSAKDPVNMVGYMVDNIENGMLKQWHIDDIEQIKQEKDVILLDTRTVREYERGHVEGFINIPVDDIRDRLDELEKGKKVYVMCQSGLRSYIATRILIANGFDAYNLSGGYGFYNIVKNESHLVKKSTMCGMEFN